MRADGFHDAEGAWGEVVWTCVKAKLHRGGIEDFWQEDGLAFGDELVEKLTGIDFVGEGVISHDNPGIDQMRTQTGDDRLRQFFQPGRGVLLLQTANLTTKVFFMHGLSPAPPWL